MQVVELVAVVVMQLIILLNKFISLPKWISFDNQGNLYTLFFVVVVLLLLFSLTNDYMDKND